MQESLYRENKTDNEVRFAEHRGYVSTQDDTQATGAHFTSPGHRVSDMSILILEQVRSSDDVYRREREKYFIRKFNTYHKGLYRQP